MEVETLGKLKKYRKIRAKATPLGLFILKNKSARRQPISYKQMF